MALPDGVTLVDSFPFDSSPTLITTVNGYKRGDRSVDAWTMQEVFAKFFSDGVFPNPGTALQIGKAAAGLAVTIQPGMFIINGGMGGIKADAGPMTLQLDSSAAEGDVCYAVMLRYDNNTDMRSLGFRVVKGVAGSNPQPPAPDKSTANVMEYRLGYVTVPNGATDLSDATVTNEKGLAACPYAAPFEEIDMTGVTSDARESANEALGKLLDYFEQYRDTIDAALSGEEATHLQQQITQIQEQLEDFDIDLGSEVDDSTIEYTGTDNPVDPKKLRVKDGGITSKKIATLGIATSNYADASVTGDKLSAELQMLLNIFDWDEMTGSAAKSIVDSGNSDLITQMVTNIPNNIVQSWSTEDQIYVLSGITNASENTQMLNKMEFAKFAWTQMDDLFDAVATKSNLVGKTKNVDITGYGTHTFRIIGINHDDAASGGKIKMTWQSTKVVLQKRMAEQYMSGGTGLFDMGELGPWLISDFITLLPSDLQSVLKEATVGVDKYTGVGTYKSTANTKVSLCSGKELGDAYGSLAQYSSTYDYWSGKSQTDRQMDWNGSKIAYWTRDAANTYANGAYATWNAQDYLSNNKNVADKTIGVVPVFFI